MISASDDELALAVSAGIRPVRIVFYCDHVATRTTWHAVGLGVACFTVRTERQMGQLSACAPRPQRVLVDVTGRPAGDLLAGVLAEDQLQLIGLHLNLGSAGHPAEEVNRVLGQMAQLSRDHAVVLSRLSLACLSR
jgi:diaminopimelate decarboxylase